MNIITANGQIAVEVMDVSAAQTKRVGGLTVIDQKVSLVKTKVVFSNDRDAKVRVDAGMYIWLDGTVASNSAWAKRVYELDGKQFVLVPEGTVIFVGIE